MQTLLNISEASIIALHAAGLLAENPGRPLTTREMAKTLGVSQAHLSKVLQRLARSGLVKPVRGPGGGFVPAVAPDEIKAGKVLEAIDGPVKFSECLIRPGGCGKKGCFFVGMLRAINRQVREMMQMSVAKL